MRGDLQHGIDGGVADRLQRPQVLLAEALDDLGAGGVAIAEYAGQLGARDQVARQFGGKAGVFSGK